MNASLSYESLRRRLRGLPMVRVVIPLAIGILIAGRYCVPIALLCCLIALLLAASFFTSKSRYTFLLLLAVGVLRGSTITQTLDLPIDRVVGLIVRVESNQVRSDGRSTGEGVVEAWHDPQADKWHTSSARILLRTDSLTTIRGGEQLLIQTRIYPIRGGSSSYRRLMSARGFVGRCYLNDKVILNRQEYPNTSLHLRAAQQLQLLTAEATDQEAAAVVRAMTLADRSGVNDQMRDRYAQSGLSHLLAVSGLHTGIVFVLINLALGWMIFLRRGIVWRNLVAVLLLWLYVAATDFQPSAVRAAIMCSLLQWSLSSLSIYNSLNSCAAAAAMMLLWHPQWIYDISFQLSMVAVVALISWGGLLFRTVKIRQPIVRYLLQGICVALIASVATAPLVSHAFGRLSWIGIVTTPIVIPLAAITIGAGLCLLLLPLLKGVLLPLATGCAHLQNQLAAVSGEWEAGHFDYTLSAWSTVTCYLMLLVVTLLLWSVKRKKKEPFM